MKKQDSVYKPRYILWTKKELHAYHPNGKLSIYPNELILKDKKIRLSYYVWDTDYDFQDVYDWALIKLTKQQYLDLLLVEDNKKYIDNLINNRNKPWDKIEFITIEEARRNGPY